MADPVMLGRLGQALVDILDPLRRALDAPEAFEALLRREGWQPPPTRDYFTAVSAAFRLAGAVEAAVAAIEALLAGDHPDPSAVLAVIDRVTKVVADLRSIAKPAGTLPPPFDTDAFWQTFPSDLVADLFMRYMELAQPIWFAPLHLLGVLDEEAVVPTDAGRLAYTRSEVKWGRLATIFSDPSSLAGEVYGWGATFQYAKLVGRLERVLLAFGVPAGHYVPHRSLLDLYYASTVPPNDVRELRVPLIEERRPDTGFVRAGLLLLPIPAAGTPAAAPVGFFVGPYAYGQTAARVELGGSLALELKGGLESGGTAGVEVRPQSFVAHLGSTGTDLDIEAALSFEPASPFLLVGSEDSHRIELGKSRLGLALTGPAATPELQLTLGFDPLSAVFDPSDGDSFLTELFGSKPRTATASGILVWSSKTGLHWSGQATLGLDVPLHVTLGPLTIADIRLAIATASNAVSLSAGVTASAQIGPVGVVVSDIGVELSLTSVTPPACGTFGDLDLGFGFKPPSGIGLSIEAGGVVTGGGFVFHDATQSLYAGSLMLSLNETLTLSAFGLIATKMPDGSPGYSMIVFITAEDFEPIPLGLGFTLQGIGGMVAINRTFDQDVLRAGMQNDTLKTLLFPQNPVANAPAIIRSLASAFPARGGSYLLGILAKIGWFTPTLIEFDLALILEFGGRERLLVLGRISSILPSPDNDLVRIILDAIGVLDFDQDTAAIDAMLVDSRLVHKYALTGAAALRAGWGSAQSTDFVLSIGGFNPRFAPPAGVPPLARVAIALSSGNNPRLTCDAYFAITSNTIQFGAEAQLYAEAYGFSVSGDVGFDVLITRLPLHFIADFRASVQLKHGSDNLFKVSVEGELEGPQPLRLSGKASFEIFWCDFSVHFDATLIDGEPPPPPPAVDVLAQLEAALSTAQSWSIKPPPGRSHGVALRKLAPGTGLILDPLGQLAVEETVVPLDTGRDIDVFGGAPVAGARRFALSVALNGVALTETQVLQAPFAPAQFFAMSDDEELASPSFETMDSGLVVGSNAVSFDAGQLVAAPVQYQTFTIDPKAAASVPPGSYTLPAVLLALHSISGSAARAPVRRVGQARFRSAAPAAVALAPPSWAIVPLDGGGAVTVSPSVKTWTDYRAALDTLNRAGTAFQLVPAAALAA